MKKIIFALLLLLCCNTFAVINPVYEYAKEYLQQRILFLENKKVSLENLIAWLTLIGAPQYLIDERQSELDAVNAELEYLHNIGLLE